MAHFPYQCYLNGLKNVNLIQFLKVIRYGPSTQTRGHPLKLETQYSRTEKCRNFFSVRAVKNWNKLPRDIVLAENLNLFKNEYDNHINNVRASTTMSHAPQYCVSLIGKNLQVRTLVCNTLMSYRPVGVFCALFSLHLEAYAAHSKQVLF